MSMAYCRECCSGHHLVPLPSENVVTLPDGWQWNLSDFPDTEAEIEAMVEAEIEEEERLS